jgi:DNA-binding response OmpR family regulator
MGPMMLMHPMNSYDSETIALPPNRLRVLIFEESLTAAAAIEASLRADGMVTERASNGADAAKLKARFQPDVILIDIELSDASGFELVRYFANSGDCGVIVVTANDERRNCIAGLETGADDYVLKPPGLPELAARIRAVHRRTRKPPTVESAIVWAEKEQVVTIDFADRSLTGSNGARILLTEAELAALSTLLDAGGTTVSRESISRSALRRSLNREDRSVDQLVMKLRRKLQELGCSRRGILSTRCEGYVLPKPDRFHVLRLPSASAARVEIHA